jgi:hypothetical protein
LSRSDGRCEPGTKCRVPVPNTPESGGRQSVVVLMARTYNRCP